MISKIFKKLSWLNAAEATVISFFIASIIGGAAIWFTEKDRDVSYKEPVLQNVIINRVDSKTVLTPGPVVEARVAYVKETTIKGITPVDAWFTAVSALCVTGLTSTDFSTFTLPGQVITLILIQMGGLGIIVFTSLLAFAVVRGFSEKLDVKQFLSSIMDTSHDDVGHMLKHVLKYTIVFEGLATIIMGIHLQWFANPELIKGINPWWWALFHSVSAFNNAGFGLLNDNLMSFVTDPVINLTIAGLIILGGLGYPVLISIHAALRKKFKPKHLRDKVQMQLEEDVKGVVASPLQTRVAIWISLALLTIGTIFSLTLDFGGQALANYSIPEKIMITFFQSVSTRTAGFNTIDLSLLNYGTLMLYCVLMVIGANPAGTAGGIKIPTVAVLYAYLKDWFKEPGKPVQLFNRTISKFALSHAMRLFFFSVIFIFTVVIAICSIENQFMFTPDNLFNFMKVIFETFSAFGTVGLSLGFQGGVTSFSAILSPISKVLIIITMFFGRIGPLTFLAALPAKRIHANAPNSPDYVDAQRIQIG